MIGGETNLIQPATLRQLPRTGQTAVSRAGVWRRRMGEQARARAERDHALDRMTGEYVDLYREVLRCS